MAPLTISAVVNEIRGNYGETARVTASYESANIISSLAFEVPYSQAKEFFVGQKLTVSITQEPA